MLAHLVDDALPLTLTDSAFMRPVSFAGCFGWLHTAPHAMAGQTAVVLCRGLKDDGLTGHRGLRQMADALAQAGYPTLRFDYPGTGDACDPEGDDPKYHDHWQAWRRSVHDAVDFLRAHAGADRVVLGGLRLGATLAALAAGERADVAGILLLAPVLRGRSYVRQLSIEAKLQNAESDDGMLVVQELRLSPEALCEIGTVDLRSLAITAPCAIGVFAEATPVLSDCVAAWQGRGAQVTCEGFEGLEALLRPTFRNDEASADPAPIVDWLRRALPPARARQASRSPQPARLTPPGCDETPLHFGPHGALFGMLCRPAGRDGDQVVLICNGGGDPHYGFARASVSLARHLAAEGIASLRMDFAGIGDSQAPDDADVHVLEADRTGDIKAALDALEAIGYRRFAVQGLCAGAYHGFHAALADPRIGTLLLVNMPLFQFANDGSLAFLNQAMQSPADVLKRLRGLEGWKRVALLALRGELDIKLRMHMQAAWLVGRAGSLLRQARSLAGLKHASFAQVSMERLATRANTLFLLAEGDAGVSALVNEFGPTPKPPGATVQIIRGLDHALSSAAMRQLVAHQMVAFLRSTPRTNRPKHRTPRAQLAVSGVG